jgi:hypothetical protein
MNELNWKQAYSGLRGKAEFIGNEYTRYWQKIVPSIARILKIRKKTLWKKMKESETSDEGNRVHPE